jgi:carboxymethylenebutenolidase
MDAGGPRPAMDEMMERIAAAGYVVIMPDLLHRVGLVFDLIPEGRPRTSHEFMTAIADPAKRRRLITHYVASALNDDHARMDLGAALACLDARPDVRRGPIGVTGYCMGGNVALRAAAMFADRVAAAASFHGGNLASDDPDSPHRRAAAIRAEVYVAGAVEDASFPDDMKERLRAALEAAGVVHTIETYPGARHGFAVPSHPAYQEAAARRHDAALLDLFRRRLGA